VGDVLSEEGVALPEGTFVDPPADAAISDGLAVRVVQLSASREIEREFIKSRTVYRSDPSLGPGQTRTEAGQDGALVRRYDVQYANGVEAGRTLIEEYYEPEPVDTVIYYPVQTGVGQDAPAEGEVVRVLNVYATYYTPASSGRSPNDPAYGRTATGVLVTYGIVAVDPTVIPLGTRMFIPGYGYAIAADTGGAVKGYIIDLGYPDGVPVDWRSRWLDIYILS
jgi:3D (Asp-Asp-Asp) domain-containing protein